MNFKLLNVFVVIASVGVAFSADKLNSVNNRFANLARLDEEMFSGLNRDSKIEITFETPTETFFRELNSKIDEVDQNIDSTEKGLITQLINNLVNKNPEYDIVAINSEIKKIDESKAHAEFLIRKINAKKSSLNRQEKIQLMSAEKKVRKMIKTLSDQIWYIWSRVKKLNKIK